VKFQYERHEARKVDIANQSQTCEQTYGKLSPFDDNSNHAGLIDSFEDFKITPILSSRADAGTPSVDRNTFVWYSPVVVAHSRHQNEDLISRLIAFSRASLVNGRGLRWTFELSMNHQFYST